MKHILIFIALFIFIPSVFSAIISPVRVEGIIVSYDKKTVTLSQGGEKTQVPRKTIPSHFKIKSGNQVYALFDGEDVMKKLIEEKQKKDKIKKAVKAKKQK